MYQVRIQFLIFFLLLITSLSAQKKRKKYDYFDGPYIHQVDDSLHIQWIADGKLYKDVRYKDQPGMFETVGLPIVNLNKLTVKKDSSTEYTDVKKYAAISDIHGQYDVFYSLLRRHKIIDKKGNWSYGDGHLVIVGDMLDRGDKVTEVMWLLFQLEHQAQKAGGKVHVLLGNHEIMVMNGNIRYVHKKYRYSSGITKTPYPLFFDQNTFLGQWLASKNITVSINDHLFVHGGFSKEIVDLNYTQEEINDLFHSRLLYAQSDSIKEDPELSMFYFNNGPLWYRGYADAHNFDADQAKYILEKLGKKRIIVGHTSMPKIMSLFDRRIILVDSSIKFGKQGEILLYEDGKFFRGLFNGKRKRLKDEKKKKVG